MNESFKKSSLIQLNRWLEWKARSSEKLRQFGDAAEFWEKLLKRLTRESSQGHIDVSKLAAIHYRLGLAHRALNDDRKSLYHLKYSVRLNSSEPRYYEAFGRAFLSGGHWRVAKTQFEKAIRLDPKNVVYLRQYAWVLMMMDLKNEALVYAKRAYDLQKCKDSLMSLVRIYMELEMYLHALQLLKTLKKSDRVVHLINECNAKMDATLEGAVIRCLRKGIVCDGAPFSLWDLRQAEELWTEFCLKKPNRSYGRSLPNVWAAAVAWLSLYVKKPEAVEVDMDQIAERFAATTLEIWPCIKNLQDLLALSSGAPKAA